MTVLLWLLAIHIILNAQALPGSRKYIKYSSPSSPSLYSLTLPLTIRKAYLKNCPGFNKKLPDSKT
jgi:hypothetical protein